MNKISRAQFFLIMIALGNAIACVHQIVNNQFAGAALALFCAVFNLYFGIDESGRERMFEEE